MNMLINMEHDNVTLKLLLGSQCLRGMEAAQNTHAPGSLGRVSVHCCACYSADVVTSASSAAIL